MSQLICTCVFHAMTLSTLKKKSDSITHVKHNSWSVSLWSLRPRPGPWSGTGAVPAPLGNRVLGSLLRTAGCWSVPGTVDGWSGGPPAEGLPGCLRLQPAASPRNNSGTWTNKNVFVTDRLLYMRKWKHWALSSHRRSIILELAKSSEENRPCKVHEK